MLLRGRAERAQSSRVSKSTAILERSCSTTCGLWFCSARVTALLGQRPIKVLYKRVATKAMEQRLWWLAVIVVFYYVSALEQKWMGVDAKAFGNDEQRMLYRLLRSTWNSRMYPLDVKSPSASRSNLKSAAASPASFSFEISISICTFATVPVISTTHSLSVLPE